MEHKAGIARTDLEQLLVDETAEPKALPLSLLEEITGDFSDDQVIGSGGFAVVYKGILGDMVVAVKKLADAFMDENIFHREVECLMRVKHKNVVRFLGYCADRQGRMETYEGKLVMADFHQRLLCFEYIPKGSLDKYIIDPHREWGMCYQIIEGICQGLQKLHENYIVHLDLKPANILLDDNMTAKITDFGLSRCFNENQSRDITKTIFGTIGYMAPELHEGGIIARSADIYSLGVIMIEILTGQKGYQATEVVLESWRGRLEISQQETLCQQIQVCYETALECISFNPLNRPSSARNVFERLHQMESNQMKNPQKVGGGGNGKKNSDKKGGGSRRKRNPDKGDESDEHKYPNMDGRGGEQKKNSDIGGGDGEHERNPDKSVRGEERDKSPDKISRGSGQKNNPEKSGGADKVDKYGSGPQPKDKEDQEKKMQLPVEETKPTVYGPLLSVDKVASSAPREVTTVLLKFQLHCEGCGKKVRRYLRRFEGVHETRVDAAKGEVVVVGSMDVAHMRKFLWDKCHKWGEILWTSKKEEKMDRDGSGESQKMQNHNSAAVENVHKDDKGTGIEESAASMAPDQKDNGGSGNDERKQNDKSAVAGDVRKEIESDGPSSIASEPAPAHASPVWAPHPPPSYYNYYRGNADGVSREANAGRYYHYQQPDPQPYQPYPPYGFAPPPQMFSDENPNSCSVM